MKSFILINIAWELILSIFKELKIFILKNLYLHLGAFFLQSRQFGESNGMKITQHSIIFCARIKLKSFITEVLKTEERIRFYFVMITKYFTKVSVKFNPFTPGAKPARLFLSRIPTSLKPQCAVDYKVLTELSKEKPVVEVTFKDKHKMEVDPEKVNFVELSNHFDSHSRKLAIKDAITE